MRSFQGNNHATISGRISRGQNQTDRRRAQARLLFVMLGVSGMEDIVIGLYSLVFPVR